MDSLNLLNAWESIMHLLPKFVYHIKITVVYPQH
jgi:hypothetical protein